MKAPICILALAALLCLLAGSAASADSPEVRMELNPRNISIDETATLQITVKNVHSADIEMVDVDGLVFHSRGRSSRIQIVNGAVASSVVYTYLVEPIKEGSHEIPPIRVDAGGKTFHTEAQILTVTAPAGGQSRSRPGRSGKPEADRELAFIKFSPAKQAVYRGEVIPVVIKVYFRQGTRVDQLSLPRLQGEGLLIDELSGNPPQTQEMVGDTAYSVLVWDTYVTGVKEGIHDLSFTLDATVLVPSSKRSPLPGFGSGFFNDDFFGDLFSNYDSRPVRISSEKKTLEVMPLPDAARPDSFSGAVGRFSLNVDAQPATIEPGEPITLTMHVQGTGNFAAVEAPTLSDTAGIKTYSPSAEFTAEQSPYSGTKLFQQAIIITDPAAQEIPPVIFSYFDPDARRYKTLFSDPIPVNINKITVETEPPTPPEAEPSPTPKKSTQSADNSMAPQSISLVPVKLTPGTLVTNIRPPFQKPWFVTITALCILGITGFSGYRIYHQIQRKDENIAYKKALAAKRKETLAGLAELNPDAPDYPARARILVGEFLILRERLDRASLTTSDVIDCCGPESAAAELFRLADTALYGKRQASAVDVRGLHKRLTSFIADMS